MNDDQDIEVIEEDLGQASKIQKLKRDLDVCRKEKEEYLAGWQRAKADYVNLDRTAREREARTGAYAEEKILKELLDIADSFERAFNEFQDDSPWAVGIKNVHEKLKSILKKYEVEAIESHGQRFDPNLHEAVDVVETDDPEADNHIAQVLQKGYMIKGTILRPSRVTVAHYKK